MNSLLTSCVQEPEAPRLEPNAGDQLARVKSWFEENKTNLRLPERGSNFRTESQELILPFFEKEPDWDQFHHYYFPDGREVFEVSLENATKYFPTSMLDSFPDRDPAELVIQNLLFVKHPTQERFDPLIARYYPDNQESLEDFKSISYGGIPYDWSGKVDIWTYDERHFIGFIFDNGELTHHSTYQLQTSMGEARIMGDCRTIIREISNNYTGRDGIVVVRPPTVVVEVVCTGSGGYTPSGNNGNDGSDYHDYERPPCCDDPVPAPPRDLPSYDPPTIPSPNTIVNRLTNPCASRTFKQLSKGSQYLTAAPNDLGALDIFPGMLDLFEQSGKFDYQIQNGIVPNGANAKTDLINGMLVITIDNNYLSKATSLSLARTIIHETVHAYLWKQTKIQSDLNSLQLLNFYWEKYKSSGDGRWPDTHHAAMSEFILGMAVSLYNWDKKHGPSGGSLGFDYYYKMAFGGLVRDDDPTKLIEEAKQFIPKGSSWAEIQKILNNEATGTNQANGTKCN
ncbi:hypothetical protein [Algoriphagus sp. oki45]|uniref:hypothetical protein n=1 Tax=Algoriphagus sp. oki45 TaxID=3067294 RepID=UPI0030C6EAE1